MRYETPFKDLFPRAFIPEISNFLVFQPTAFKISSKIVLWSFDRTLLQIKTWSRLDCTKKLRIHERTRHQLLTSHSLHVMSEEQRSYFKKFIFAKDNVQEFWNFLCNLVHFRSWSGEVSDQNSTRRFYWKSWMLWVEILKNSISQE
jgi:hypothetical protein